MLIALCLRCCRTQLVTYKYMLPPCVRQRLGRGQSTAWTAAFCFWWLLIVVYSLIGISLSVVARGFSPIELFE